jgi:hypothetical protein
MSKKAACIVVPVYKNKLSDAERASLVQLLEVMPAHDILLACPAQLQVSTYEEVFKRYNRPFRIERFDDHFFADINGYNQLMLQAGFYNRFSSYHYMLIYQLDAWIFRDELDYWCQQGYDYIGAPWMDEDFARRYWVSNSRIGYWLDKASVKPNTVGNGGFSLRKISTFTRVLKLFHAKASIWNSNEDIFWALYVPYYYPFFKIPSLQKALHFAFETDAEACMKITNHQMPMGCHAWEKHDRVFWQQYIQA